MPRRKTKNITGLSRIEGIQPHNAWVGFVCLKCRTPNVLEIGNTLLDPQSTFDTANWKCSKCKYIHGRSTDLPFKTWKRSFRDHRTTRAERFWLGFFRIATEHPESYWKQCNACGRVLPFHAFSKHTEWRPLERQMECRSCKGAINAVLNPRRTKQQLHEGSIKRRIADLLLEGANENVSIQGLFKRFGSRCFKTKRPLNITDRRSWAIDHILPSKYLYPLTTENAALLSAEANNAKRDRWPREFYTNNELIELSKITGADLNLLSRRAPVVNSNIDVDGCVSRFLRVRERSNLAKRLTGLRKLLSECKLVDRLSVKNKKMLGIK